MDPNQQSSVSPSPVQVAPVVTPSIPQVQTSQLSTKVPWSFLSTMLAGFFFGLGTSYLLIWQNMKRIGVAEKEQHRYLLLGGGVIFTLALIVAVFPASVSAVGLIFPIWFERKYFKIWKQQHPDIKPHIDAGYWGWVVLGILFTIVLFAFAYGLMGGLGLAQE